MTSSKRFGRLYRFDKAEIEKYISAEGGNYRLGVLDDDGNFIVTYVGRAQDLEKRLKEHDNDPHYYEYFSVRYEPNELRRYYIECREYHYWRKKFPLYNKNHPAKPACCGDKYTCPDCGR